MSGRLLENNKIRIARIAGQKTSFDANMPTMGTPITIVLRASKLLCVLNCNIYFITFNQTVLYLRNHCGRGDSEPCEKAKLISMGRRSLKAAKSF
tara:strand:- start:125 stop:409 length:285 start_codon:yes stop_codon:yes gene_type:complete